MVLGLLEAKAALSASPGEVQVSAVAGQTRPPWDPGQTCGLLSLFARAWSHPSGSRACEGRLAVPGVWVAEGWGQVGAPGRPSAGRVPSSVSGPWLKPSPLPGMPFLPCLPVNTSFLPLLIHPFFSHRTPLAQVT